jgi:hypothetical protein
MGIMNTCRKLLVSVDLILHVSRDDERLTHSERQGLSGVVMRFAGVIVAFVAEDKLV